MLNKVLFAITIITMGVMFILDIPLKNDISQNGIISFELAYSLDHSIAILNSWDEKAKLHAGISLGFDYLFMTSYSILLFSLIRTIIDNLSNEFLIEVGKTLSIMMIFAGLLDALENYALIELYLGNLKQVYSSIAFYSASLKFAFIGFGITFIVISYTKLSILNKR